MDHNIAWAAGLIEGEGCFTIVKNSKAKKKASAKLVVQMNDKDVLDRLYSVFNVGKIYYRPPRNTSKESWSWTVYKSSDLTLVADQIYPLMGTRRQRKIDEIKEFLQ